MFAPHLRGLGHLVVRGFVMEHCANQYDDGFWVARTQPNNPSPANESRVDRTRGSSCRFGWTLGQLFLDGAALWELPPGAALQPMSWRAAKNGTQVYARFRDTPAAPADGAVEARPDQTASRSLLAPALNAIGSCLVAILRR